MSVETGTLAYIDSGSNVILVAPTTSQGTVYFYVVTSTATITRDGFNVALGNLKPTDSITVTDDGSGNASSLVATSQQPL